MPEDAKNCCPVRMSYRCFWDPQRQRQEMPSGSEGMRRGGREEQARYFRKVYGRAYGIMESGEVARVGCAAVRAAGRCERAPLWRNGWQLRVFERQADRPAAGGMPVRKCLPVCRGDVCRHFLPLGASYYHGAGGGGGGCGSTSPRVILSVGRRNPE